MFEKQLPEELEREIYKIVFNDVIYNIHLMGKYTDYWLYNVQSLCHLSMVVLEGSKLISE